ncbi:S-layer protein domain-containing protein [Methanococcoides sp.]|uniref:S-layer protein domain-containing protein n=1 Tax=Methanococcoides sp. TaxID=1966350 RepID=UPI00272ED524|nr:S-layer protein domain-containing protein [Methanococcoides sp.]
MSGEFKTIFKNSVRLLNSINLKGIHRSMYFTISVLLILVMSAGLVSAYDADTNNDHKLNFIKFDEKNIFKNNFIPIDQTKILVDSNIATMVTSTEPVPSSNSSSGRSGGSSAGYLPMTEGSGQLLWSYESNTSDPKLDTYLSDDINTDGIIDFVVCDEDEILVLSGSDGSIIWNKSCAGYAKSVISLNNDIDNDGFYDIAISWSIYDDGLEQYDIYVELLSGSNGNSIWVQKIASYDWMSYADCWLTPVEDASGDGSEDILAEIYYESNIMTYILSSADGSSLCTISDNIYWEFTDFTGDGLTDFVIDNYDASSHNLSVIKGNDGTLVWESDFNGTLLGIIDADGNGISDLLIVTNNGRNLNVLRGNDGSEIWSIAGTWSTNEIPQYASVLNDVNDDGIDDFAIFLDYISGDEHIERIQFRSGSNGNLIWNWEVPIVTDDIYTCNDIDGDGTEDIICTNHVEVGTNEYIFTINIFKGMAGTEILDWSEQYSFNEYLDPNEWTFGSCDVYTWTSIFSDISGDGIPDPILEIENMCVYTNEETSEYFTSSRNLIFAIDGSDGSTIWKFKTGKTGEYPDLWVVLEAWLDLNNDNIDDYLFANTNGVYAISTTEDQSSVAIISPENEIRGPVFTGDLSTWDSNSIEIIDAQNFAGFYYNLDDDQSGETLTLYQNGTLSSRILDSDAAQNPLVYRTSSMYSSPNFEFMLENDPSTFLLYQTVGFMGEQYVPIIQDDLSKLSPLLIDNDFKYTMRIGQTLELGEGYAVIPKQIDVEGEKVWLELTKNGNFIDDEVISTDASNTTSDTTWYIRQDVSGEDDVLTLIIHVKEAFQGQFDSLVVLEGVWQISDRVMEINVGDKYEKMIVSSINNAVITMELDDDIFLDAGSTNNIMGNLEFRVADEPTLRFYLRKTLIESGIYEIRGNVLDSPSSNESYSWNAHSFAGFWYDFNNNVTSEVLNVRGIDNFDRTLDADSEEFVYTTTIVSDIQPNFDFKTGHNPSEDWTYEKIGLWGEEYVPIDHDPSILTKLLTDDGSSNLIRIGNSLDLGEGYTITPKQIDVEGEKVWIELTKNGTFVDDEVINAGTNATTSDKTYYYEQDILNEVDVLTLMIHVDEVNQSGNYMIIDGIWQLSDQLMEIEFDDEFGVFEISSLASGPSGYLKMESYNDLTLRKDSVIELTDGFNFMVADSEELKFYPFREYNVIIENEIPTANISSIIPNIANLGDLVTFSGTGTDNDGSITAYLWTSDLDGQLSTSENFSTSVLSLGTHTIYFKVQDDDGAWSDDDSATVTINELPNVAPIAEIISIDPTTATEDTEITFNGSGTDSDGMIIGYDWNSSIDGQLSTSENFSTSALSLGTHTIYFSVQDDDSVWSATDSATVTINEKPNVAPTAEILSIDPSTATEGTEITFNGSGTDSDGTIIGYDWNSSIDGQLSTSENFSTSGLSLGTHTVYFKVQDNDGVWSAIDSVAVNIIDDLAAEAHISAYPLEYISIYNPVTINLNSTDAHLASTELIIADSEGHEIINLTIAKDDPNSATYEYVWNATDKDELPVSSGAYILFVNSTDTSGNFASANVSITVDNEKPIVTFEDIRGFTSDNNIVYANATLLINVSASGTPGDVNSVEYTLSSTFTNYKKNMSAELIDGNWTAIFDLSCIHDDGQYILTANAIDAAMNLNSTVSDTLIVVDRTSPIFSSTASMYNETHGMVSVISSESVIGYPIVEVNSDVIEVAQTSGKWTGYFQLDTEQIFNVNVTGTDIAGNIGSGSSVVVIEKIEFTNGTGLFNSSQIDTFITFNTTNDTIGNIIVTESMDPMANLTDDSIGLYFISVELDSNLKENISSAIIAIPINSVTLPDGINTKDVSILYCNETEELWEICPTSIEIIDGKEYWITYVNHFSIYGVVVSDTIAPILDSVTPVSGTTFAQDTTFVNIRFNYNDQQSGINVSSIIFNFDDIEITDNSLEITSNYTSYNATGLSSGSYTASITVADNAGNSVPFSTSFSITDGLDNVVDDNGNHGGISSSSSGGGASGEAFANIAFKSVRTENIIEGLKISYAFDDEQSVIEYINFSALKNYGRVSTTIEVLKGKSIMVDESAPGLVYSNLNIWVGRSGFATENNIAEPQIGFSVAKDWLTKNGIDERSIALYRHNGGKWNALKTTTIGEDNSYIYFEAETPGFSAFAIAADVDDANVPAKTVSEDEISGSGNNTEAEIPEIKSNNIPGCTMFTSIFILVFACLFRKRKN